MDGFYPKSLLRLIPRSQTPFRSRYRLPQHFSPKFYLKKKSLENEICLIFIYTRFFIKNSLLLNVVQFDFFLVSILAKNELIFDLFCSIKKVFFSAQSILAWSQFWLLYLMRKKEKSIRKRRILVFSWRKLDDLEFFFGGSVIEKPVIKLIEEFFSLAGFWLCLFDFFRGGFSWEFALEFGWDFAVQGQAVCVW